MPTPPAIVTANPIDSRRILKRGRKRNGSVRLSRCLKYGNWNELTWSGHIWCRRMKKTWKRGLGSQPGVWGWVARINFNLHRFKEMRTLRLVQDCVISRYDRANINSITTGALNFKMAALRFIGVTEEVMNVKKKTEFRRAQKLLLCLEWHFFNRRIRSFCWFNLMNPSDSNGSWLYTSIRVIKTIKTEFFNIKTNIYNRIRKHLGNCTKTIIPRRLGEYCWICCGLVEKYSLRLQRIIC